MEQHDHAYSQGKGHYAKPTGVLASASSELACGSQGLVLKCSSPAKYSLTAAGVALANLLIDNDYAEAAPVGAGSSASASAAQAAGSRYDDDDWLVQIDRANRPSLLDPPVKPASTSSAKPVGGGIARNIHTLSSLPLSSSSAAAAPSVLSPTAAAAGRLPPSFSSPVASSSKPGTPGSGSAGGAAASRDYRTASGGQPGAYRAGHVLGSQGGSSQEWILGSGGGSSSSGAGDGAPVVVRSFDYGVAGPPPASFRKPLRGVPYEGSFAVRSPASPAEAAAAAAEKRLAASLAASTQAAAVAAAARTGRGSGRAGSAGVAVASSSGSGADAVRGGSAGVRRSLAGAIAAAAVHVERADRVNSGQAARVRDPPAARLALTNPSVDDIDLTVPMAGARGGVSRDVNGSSASVARPVSTDALMKSMTGGSHVASSIDRPLPRASSAPVRPVGPAIPFEVVLLIDNRYERIMLAHLLSINCRYFTTIKYSEAHTPSRVYAWSSSLAGHD